MGVGGALSTHVCLRWAGWCDLCGADLKTPETEQVIGQRCPPWVPKAADWGTELLQLYLQH